MSKKSFGFKLDDTLRFTLIVSNFKQKSQILVYHFILIALNIYSEWLSNNQKIYLSIYQNALLIYVTANNKLVLPNCFRFEKKKQNIPQH